MENDEVEHVAEAAPLTEAPQPDAPTQQGLAAQESDTPAVPTPAPAATEPPVAHAAGRVALPAGAVQRLNGQLMRMIESTDVGSLALNHAAVQGYLAGLAAALGVTDGNGRFSFDLGDYTMSAPAPSAPPA